MSATAPSRPAARVADVMTREVEVLGPEASVAQAAEVMLAVGVGIVPIVSDGRPVGVLTSRDVVTRVVATRRDPDSTRVSDVMTKDPAVCSAGAELPSAAGLMARRGVRRLLVLRGDGRLGGVLSSEQVVSSGESETRKDEEGRPSAALSRAGDIGSPADTADTDEETMSEAGRREIKDPSIEERAAGRQAGTGSEAAAPARGDGRQAAAGTAGQARLKRSSACPNCGMEKEEWSAPEGYPKEGLVYCCEGCAEDRGCVCFHAVSDRRPASQQPEAEAPPRPEPRTARSQRSPRGAPQGGAGASDRAVPRAAPASARGARRSSVKREPSAAEPGTVGDEGGAGENRGRGPAEA